MQGCDKTLLKFPGLRKGRLVLFGLLAAILVFAGACREKPPLPDASDIPLTELVFQEELTPPYKKAVKKWTAEARIYQGLDPRLLVWATYKSPEFRRAFVKEYSADYLLRTSEAEKMLADQLAAAASGYDFLVAVSAPDYRDRDISSKNSLWRVFLETDSGRRLEPFEIAPINKKTFQLVNYFSYITAWTDLYQVRFMKPGTRSIPSGSSWFLPA